MSLKLHSGTFGDAMDYVTCVDTNKQNRRETPLMQDCEDDARTDCAASQE